MTYVIREHCFYMPRRSLTSTSPLVTVSHPIQRSKMSSSDSPLSDVEHSPDKSIERYKRVLIKLQFLHTIQTDHLYTGPQTSRGREQLTINPYCQ